MSLDTAILLCNLGSPDDCTEKAVRRYLDQFLMDPSVIQLPWIVRRLIVSLLVLPKRPKASASAYKKIWSADGSPLISLSKKLVKSLQQEIDNPVFLSMRYGSPSIENKILEIAKNPSIKQIYFIPLYPHFADSTVATSILEAQRVIKNNQLKIGLNVHSVFYNDSGYISALLESCAPYIFERSSNGKSLKRDNMPHVLFSYHGLPESHLVKADPTKAHCLAATGDENKTCCQVDSIAHQTCYQHQVLETTRLFIEAAGLSKEQYTISFQSRLGRAKWLEPSTENTLVELAKKGVKDVVVICPAFVTDCLETLEEIAIQGKATFENAGGRSLRLIPCLNDHPDWVKVVAGWCRSIDLAKNAKPNN
ncbi:MAG: ferrochelatase [Kangiellaceae bacterium]|nr:ferrochelatase [Kangiellaceae bacterium]